MDKAIFEIVISAENIEWVKDILLPLTNIMVTLFAGVVVIYYLHSKTARSDIKEKLCDLYFSINDNYLKLHSSSMNELVKYQIYRYFPERSTRHVHEAFEDAVEFYLSKLAGDKLLVLIELNKNIHYLEFLLGDTKFNENFKPFNEKSQEFAFFASKVNLYNEVEFNVKLDQAKIDEITGSLIDNYITKNECRDRLIELMSPTLKEAKRIVDAKSEITGSPYISTLKKIIKTY
ncbi:hypothetical protein OPW32_23730 [Vibrio europaeus]|uniref:hypothetical protein n=1 Tax=Vibrio europaeus TaxID=300876 RepID=UPI0023413AC3|nr:hypothetical protein [Vibrio europaeus]MDC5852208.1 hypothetical protein [Vibrio europaeus]